MSIFERICYPFVVVGVLGLMFIGAVGKWLGRGKP